MNAPARPTSAEPPRPEILMKAYFPERPPFPDPKPRRSVAELRARRLRRLRRIRRVALTCIAAALTFAASLGLGRMMLYHRQTVVAYEKALDELRTSSGALAARHRSALERLAETKRQLDLRAETVRTVTNELRRSETQLAASQRAVAAAAAERDAESRRVAESRAAIAEEGRRTFDVLISTASQVISDPAFASALLRDARSVADRCGFDGGRADELLGSLPKADRLSDAAKIEVHSVTHDGVATVVELSAADTSGRFVSGLRRVDVEVYDGARRLHAVELDEASRGGGRQNIALLLDGSLSTEGEPHAAMIDGALGFVRSLTNPARIAVRRFGDDVTPMSPWSNDALLHEDAIRSVGVHGGTALHKAIRVVAEELAARPGTKTIVLFTDGSDSFHAEPVDAAVQACRTAGVAVHVVSLKTPETKPEVLRRIATQTGGELYEAAEPTQLAAQFARAAASLRQPVYRLRIAEPIPEGQLTVTAGGLPPLKVALPPAGEARGR